mgnify:CR=1 FL=1
MNPSDNDERVARALHHAGSQPAGAPLTPPLVLTTAYVLPGDPAGDYQYARWANPTWTALDAALAALEDAPVVTFPSGMAAIAAVFYGLLKTGDRILLPSDGYYTTRILAERFLLPMGVAFDCVATAALGDSDFGGYRLLMIETPSNPALDLADIGAVSARAKAAGAIVVVDNTMMTPLGQRPLDLGADLDRPQRRRRVGGEVGVAGAGGQHHDPALLEVPHRARPDVRLAHPVHLDRRQQAGVHAALLERVLQRQPVDDRGQHAHVVRAHPVHAARARRQAPEDVPAAGHDADLDAHSAHLADLVGQGRHDRLVDAVPGPSGQLLPGELQQHAPPAAGHGPTPGPAGTARSVVPPSSRPSCRTRRSPGRRP